LVSTISVEILTNRSFLSSCYDFFAVFVLLLILRNTKKSALAREQLEKVQEWLAARDGSLAAVAAGHVPKVPPKNDAAAVVASNKKRKSTTMAAGEVDGDDYDASNGGGNNKKRKRSSSVPKQQPQTKKGATPKKKKNQNKELAEREERAMEQLAAFVEEHGGDPSKVEDYTSRVTRKKGNRFDTNYFNEEGRRFRSMLEVGRYFGLVESGASSKSKVQALKSQRKKRAGSATTNKQIDAEKKKLRRELDRLRKSHTRATKNLDDFMTDDKESRFPVDDRLLLRMLDEDDDEGGGDDTYAIVKTELQSQNSTGTALSSSSKQRQPKAAVTPGTSAAARVADIVGFPNVPDHCVPDVLMSWDFLCTFQKVLSLTPIGLDDFAAAISYLPSRHRGGTASEISDDSAAAPVYVAEAHLALLKLLLQDGYSDDWWWSNLETDETDIGPAGAGILEEDGELKPVIKVDIAALINCPEDPLITTSWLRALEDVGKSVLKDDDAKRAIRMALKLTANKWVHAYLRKALAGGKKSSSDKFMLKAVAYLVEKVRQARPELRDSSVRRVAIAKAKEKVVEEVGKQMESAPKSAPSVTDDDVLSDVEYDEDEDSDDSDDEDDANKKSTSGDDSERDESKQPSSVIPPRPPPSYVDMLLPPSKPAYNSEFVNPFTWSQLVGASAHRILHRKKRYLNEVDDYLRSTKDLSPILVAERREREKVAASRVLTECAEQDDNDVSVAETAIEHLASGKHYLQLSVVQRLCLLRLLIEAAYDTSRLYEVISGNVKQRSNAIKALEVEQRRAKREAKEKAQSDELAAREQLALEAKEKFFDDKREEIRKLNDKNHAFTDEDIEALTEEDILDFDDDFKADFEALPEPASFNKTQVKTMVARMQEEAAFDTDALRVLTMEELQERDRLELEEMQAELQNLGGEDALMDPSLDRATARQIERQMREIHKAKEMQDHLPALRDKALEQLKDAMSDGTIKVLRAAITAAKKAKLQGPDDETGGVWALDDLRDAAVELDKAKQNKRVADAQRDLVAKMNKCFIRSDPLGRDRFGNRYWTFDYDDGNDDDNQTGDNGGQRVWAEAEYQLRREGEPRSKPPHGFVDLAKDPSSITYGARDREEDFVDKDDARDPEPFLTFSRKEYHSTGFSPAPCQSRWGCQASEESIRAMIKILDSRGLRENELRNKLKESVERSGKEDAQAAEEEEDPDTQGENGDADTASNNRVVREDGDEEAFAKAKAKATEHMTKDMNNDDEFSLDGLHDMRTAVGLPVRVRQELERSNARDPVVARYESGKVVGWKSRREEVVVRSASGVSEDEDEFDSQTEMVDVPVWKVATDRGHTFWLLGQELVESASRYRKMATAGRGGNDNYYDEDDAAYFAYRNNLGRFCGKASDAPFASSPNYFSRLMVVKEAELYSRLKIRAYDNTWGGKAGSGVRSSWINSMKEFTFDLETAKQGLVTLEKGFFELTGEFADYADPGVGTSNVQELLANPEARHDVELETEMGIPGLWNNLTCRQVFLEIVKTCPTTGLLALALDLLCRNTVRYLQMHKLWNNDGAGGRSTTTTALSATGSSSFYEDALAASLPGGRSRGSRAQARAVSYAEFFA